MPVTINGTTGITTPAIVNGSALAFRNKIINGNFDIWQRGTSLISGTTSRYLADRFTNGASGTACTPSQVAFALGQTGVPNEPDYYISTIVASAVGANNNATLHQHIESVKSCAGKTVTLSFYAKSNASRNIAVELYQNFGTGGTPSANVSIPAGLVALTTSWQKFTVTVNIPSISGKTLGTAGNDSLVVYFWFDAGSSNSSRASSLGQQSGTFDIAQVQLEEGSVATPFELRPIGIELALCQRYYFAFPVSFFRQSFYNSAGSDTINNNTLHVEMRAVPNITQPTFSYTNASGAIVTSVSKSTVRVGWQSTTSNTTQIDNLASGGASAEL